MAFPAAFVERLRRIIPQDRYDACLHRLAEPDAVAFRLNPLRAEPHSTLEALRVAGLEPRPVPWYPLAWILPRASRERLTTSAPARSGALYVQNLSSQLAALMLDPQPGEEVLDLAAAPGGKTGHMAALMENRGRIGAVEAVKGRYFRLKASLETQGVVNARCYLADGRGVWRKTPERFDRVLLDAPCSSEARFRADTPESHAYWSLRKIRETSRKQQKLLFSAIQCLKPGGRLLYCTCAFAPEENEAVVDRALRTFGDALEVLPIELPVANWQPGLAEWEGRTYDPAVTRARRILPDGTMDGFFLCLLQKRRSTIKG